MFPVFTENLKKLDALGLDPEEYLITGGSVLAAHGLRDSKDIDILVSERLWTELLQKYGDTLKEFPMCKSMFADTIEIMSGVNRESVPWSIEEQLNAADMIDGKKYQTLERIKLFKKISGREKDLADIQLIEAYAR